MYIYDPWVEPWVSKRKYNVLRLKGILLRLGWRLGSGTLVSCTYRSIHFLLKGEKLSQWYSDHKIGNTHLFRADLRYQEIIYFVTYWSKSYVLYSYFSVSVRSKGVSLNVYRLYNYWVKNTLNTVLSLILWNDHPHNFTMLCILLIKPLQTVLSLRKWKNESLK